MAQVQAERGIVPREEIERLSQKVRDVDLKWLVRRQKEIEREVDHDVIAFLMALEERYPEAKWLHYGMTSSDLVDTANALLMKEAIELNIDAYQEYADALKEKALRYRYTPIIGRTHGVYAEPTTLGLKFLGFYMEALRNIGRLKTAHHHIRFGKISGAVGNYAFVDPSIEEEVMRRLGLKPEPVSTQVVPRDRYAYYVNALVMAGEGIERLALEIRLLMRTEVGEVEEPFYRKQRGSSAMPHKRNPIRSERIMGLVRYMRGLMIPAHENIALWHERDISHSSVERIVLPDLTAALYYITRLATRIVRELVVNEERIRENMERFGKFYLTQPVLLKLVSKGISRSVAYEWVKECAHSDPDRFIENLRRHPEISRHLSPEEIEEAVKHDYFRYVDYIFERALGGRH